MGTLISILIALSTLFSFQIADDGSLVVTPSEDMSAGQEIVIELDNLPVGYVDADGDGICDNFGTGLGRGLGNGNGWRNAVQ